MPYFNLFSLFIFLISHAKMLVVVQEKTERINKQIPMQISESLTVGPQNIPSQYFICGFSLLKKYWTFSSQCECKQILTFLRIRNSCSKQCVVTMDSQLCGIKLVFCHINDWSRQIQRQFSTNSSQASNYRTTQPIMCNPNYYANGFKAKFGQQYGKSLGFTDLQLNCQLLSRKNSILLNQNNYQPKDIRKLHIGSPGNFMASIRIIYESKGMLLGLIAQYQPIASIQKVRITYEMRDQQPKISNLSTLFQKKLVNCNKLSLYTSPVIDTTYSTKAKWEIPGLAGFKVRKSFIQIPTKNSKREEDLTSFTPYIDKFEFGRQIEIKFKPTKREVNYYMTKGKALQLSAKSINYQTSIKFKANIVFQNQFNHQYILEIIKQGRWEGSLHTIPYVRYELKSAQCSSTLKNQESLNENGN